MNWRRFLLIGTPYLWLLALFLVPFAIVLRLALSDMALSIPPYTPLLDLSAGWRGIWDMVSAWDFENFQWLIDDDLYYIAYLTSLRIAAVSTAITLLVAFPIAYGMARAAPEWRPALMMLVILPFWSSFLIRVYAWIGILSNEGFLNQALLWLGVIDQPLRMLNTDFAVYVGIVYTYLPFAVLPIYATLEKLDAALLEAAEDLGCSRISAFWLVVLPLSRPGLIAAAFLVFIPVVGEFIIPSILGGPDTLMIGRVLWDEFFSNRDWPVASAVAVVLLVLLIVPIVLFQRSQQRAQEADR